MLGGTSAVCVRPQNSPRFYGGSALCSAVTRLGSSLSPQVGALARSARQHQVRHERVRPRLAAAAPGRTRTATALNTLLNPFRPNAPPCLRCCAVIGQIEVMRCFTART